MIRTIKTAFSTKLLASAPAGETVLVTGGTGFIASYCIIALLNQGYKVKTTLRSLSRAADVKQMLSVGVIHDYKNLSFATGLPVAGK